MSCADGGLLGLVASGVGICLAFAAKAFWGKPKPPAPEPLDIEEALEADAKADYEKEQIKEKVEAELAEPPKEPDEMREALDAFRRKRGR